MSTLKITVLQETLSWMDGAANLRHFDSVLAGITGRDIILLPEMFTTGFAMEAAESALPQEDVVAWLHQHAKTLDALVGGSAAIQTEKGAVNRFLLVEPNGTLHQYDKRHLFRMANEHEYYVPGETREVFTWRGWRVLPQICYDLRFPVFSRNHNDYDLALYVANWPAPRALHWQALLLARAIENQAYVAGCNRVGSDANQHQYSGDSRIISPLGDILAAGEPFAQARLDAELSLQVLQEYRDRFPAWRDADAYTLKP